MPKIKYENKNFGDTALAIIGLAIRICSEYAQQGYDLTLRQLYYQFVARGHLPNKDTEYKRLGGIINDGRMAGLIDWNYIVDRTRNIRALRHFATPAECLSHAARTYNIDMWAKQNTRVEVWIEKDALIGVLDGCCPNEDVSYFSCRGYTSASEMWGASQRLREYLKTGQRVVILHLGDHDPSGVDMTRDIRERLETFITQDWLNEFGDEIGSPATIRQIWQHMDFNMNEPTGYGEVANASKPFEVHRIGLTMDQIRQYNPPPNPAKISDTRAKKYIERYGRESWELDALPPDVLTNLIVESIRALRDDDQWEADMKREKAQRALIRLTANRWKEVSKFLTTAPKAS